MTGKSPMPLSFSHFTIWGLPFFSAGRSHPRGVWLYQEKGKTSPGVWSIAKGPHFTDLHNQQG